ncbi:MAG: prepilin peptidase [Patescibacteria group bacterium]|nr:prepilin peptidase [Patescibacteria group bacterium]
MFDLVLLFVIGCCVGSFLNVLIDRLPKGSSILGRSYCENCNTPLAWFDLIPVFSFLFLWGRCRYCGEKIPFRLPLVEFLTGVGFVVVAVVSADSVASMDSMASVVSGSGLLGLVTLLNLFILLVLFCSFLVLFFTDLEYGVLPDVIVFPATVLVVFWRFFLPFFYTKYEILDTEYWLIILKQYGVPAVSLAGFFMILILITRGRGMGFGDVKLGFLMGLVLGWPGTLVGSFLAFLSGGVASVILLISGEKKFGQQVPFGPFLITGTAVAAVYGSVIWEWYLSFL